MADHPLHDTVEVYNPFYNEEIQVDKNISVLIQTLLNIDIQTMNSCEDNVPANYIWVQLKYCKDLQKIIDKLFKDLPLNDELYEKSYNWKYSVLIENYNERYEENDEEIDLQILPVCGVSCRFSKEDYSKIDERLNQKID